MAVRGHRLPVRGAFARLHHYRVAFDRIACAHARLRRVSDGVTVTRLARRRRVTTRRERSRYPTRGGTDAPAVDGRIGDGLGSKLVLFVIAVLLATLGEEFLFRGFILPRLHRALGTVAS